MTTIGYATLQIVPSLEGVSKSVDKQLGGALDGKKYGKAFGKDFSQGVVSGVKQAEAAVDKLSTSVSKFSDRQKDAADKVRLAEEKLAEAREKGLTGSRLTSAQNARDTALRKEKQSVDDLERQTRQLKRAQEELSDAQREAANPPKGDRGKWLDVLKGKANDATEAIKGIGDSSSMAALGGSGGSSAGAAFLSGFSGPIASLGTKAGPIGVALAAAALLAVGAGKLFVDQFEAGLKPLQIRDLTQARLGVDDATMGKIASAAADAFTNQWGESVESNLSAGQFAIQSGLIDKDASEDAIQGVITQLQALSTVMGVDVQEAARATGKLLITGVAGSAEEAFDLLTAGTQNGLDLTGDLIDTMEEYATKFRDVGLTGKESLGLINQLLDGGARNTDVAADALKEFSIRVVDNSELTRGAFEDLGLNADDMAQRFAAGGQSAHDAFGLVVNSINSIRDPLQREAAGVALFGTKWEDVGDAFNKVDLPTAVSNLGKIDGASRDAADKVGQHASKWDLLGRNISQAFANFQTGFTQSGFGKFFGEDLPGGINRLLFGPEPLPELPPPAPGQPLAGSGLLGEPAAPAPVQGPGLAPAPSSSALPPALAPSVTGVLVDPRVQVQIPGRAFGGPISGAGGPRSDVIPIWASNGEHMLPADEVGMMGGQAGVYQFRSMLRAGLFAGGGAMPLAGVENKDQWQWPYDPNVKGPYARRRYPEWWRDLLKKAPPPWWWFPGKKKSGSDPLGFAGGGAMDFWKLAADWIPQDPRSDPNNNQWITRGPGGGQGGKPQPSNIPPPGYKKGYEYAKPGIGNSIWIISEDGSPQRGRLGGNRPGFKGKPKKPKRNFLDPFWGNRQGVQGFAGGGAIGPDVQAAGALVGTPYSQANRTDCSGMVARVIDRTLGLPETGLMTTKTAADWLAARGFKKGIGGPGTISVGWYDHGPNPNDGHMAMTLSDGSNAEAGGGVGDIFQIGGGAAGASDPQYDQHMYLPTVYGEGAAGAGTTSPFAGGSAAAAITGAAAATPTSVSGGGTSSSGGGGVSFSLPSSIGGLAAFGLNDLGKGIGTTKSGSDLSLFGEAAGAAVSGQVDSALGVLGVNGSPGWLQAISTLVGGISIGGGGSAAPLSATSTGMGTPPPDDAGNMHGTRAGQPPGPTYYITARDTEDAFIKAQRLEREKAAAKLSRF